MQRFARYFFRGILVIVPVAATIALLWFVFAKVDRWIGAPIDKLIGLPVPGTGILVLVGGTTLIGLLASNFVTRKLFDAFEGLLARVPFVKIVYSGIRDLTGAFVGDKKGFDRPVLVLVGDGEDAGGFLGFATRDGLPEIGLPEHVAVYFPQSYNFAGNVLVVPRKRVRPVNAESSQVLAFIVSGGVSGIHGDGPASAPPPGQAAVARTARRAV